METQGRKDTLITELFPCQKPEAVQRLFGALCVGICVSAQEILPKIPNEPPGVDWQPAHRSLKLQWINLLPHTVNHTHFRWGPWRGGCRGQLPAAFAILQGPPAVRDLDEGALGRDGNPSNQATQVVHLGGRLSKAFWETKSDSVCP